MLPNPIKRLLQRLKQGLDSENFLKALEIASVVITLWSSNIIGIVSALIIYCVLMNYRK